MLVGCSKYPKPTLIQPIGDSASKRGRICIVIANRFDSSLFKARVEVLQHHIVGDRALFSRSRAFYANWQAGSQEDKIERHFLQDLAGRIDLLILLGHKINILL